MCRILSFTCKYSQSMMAKEETKTKTIFTVSKSAPKIEKERKSREEIARPETFNILYLWWWKTSKILRVCNKFKSKKKKDYKLVLWCSLHSTIPRIQQTRQAVGNKVKHTHTQKKKHTLSILQILSCYMLLIDVAATKNNVSIPVGFIWQSNNWTILKVN